MREPTLIGDRHLIQGQLSGANPDKPTLAGITPGLFCSHSHHRIDAYLDLTRLPNMQVMPRLDLKSLTLLIFALPLFIWLTPAFGFAALKHGSVFAGRSAFSRNFRWRCSIQFAIAFAAQQGPHLQTLAGLQKWSCDIPTIRQQPRVSRQVWHQMLHLLNSYLDCGLTAVDTTLRENRSPTAACGRQEHHCRELPADANGPLGMRQVGHIDDPTIWTRLGFRTGDTGAINADP